MRVTAIITCVIVLLSLPVAAQQNQYRFSKIDISQGLSNNEVNCIFKDEAGFMWFGTRSGLNRFNGYSFKVFKNDPHDSTTINDDEINQIFEGPNHTLWLITKSGLVIYNLVTEKFDLHPAAYLTRLGIKDVTVLDIKKDANNNFWFLCPLAGLNRYNPATGKTTAFTASQPGAGKTAAPVSGFCMGKYGAIWLVSSLGELQKIDAQNGHVLYTHAAITHIQPGEKRNYQVFEDADGSLWVYALAVSQGVFYLSPTSGQLVHFTKGPGKNSLNNDVVKGVSQDANGLIWVATDHGGINLINKKDFKVNYLLNHEDDEFSVAQNSITSMLIDNTGIIWVGTYKKGVCYYDKDIIKFPLYRHKISDEASLPYNDINRFVEDKKGNLWIAANGGGLIYFDRKTGKYKRYLHDAANNNSLCNDVVISLCIDHNETLWIGTYFGGLDNFDGKTFTHYRHSDTSSASIADNSVWAIMEDSHKRLWIGTFASGLDCFDREAKVFKHYRATGYHSVHCGYVCGLMEDREGNIWVSTSNGIDVYDAKTNDFSRYYHHEDANPLTSLSTDNTIALIEDSRGLIWIATREGLNIYDPAKKTFTTLHKQDGLPSNIILSVVEDKQHNIWAATPNGLSNIIVTYDRSIGRLSYQYRNYNESDGLQGKEFNEYAALVTRQGELLFGGPNGFNMFTPAQISNNNYNPQLAFTDLQMFNKSVAVGETVNGHVVLPQSLANTKQITLSYSENIFSIEFAALNFLNASRGRYAYTLQGFNNEWFIADDKTHKATYTNLNAGIYIFKVTTVDENGVKGKNTIELTVKILPPIWQTPFAYALYAVVLVLLLYLARRRVIRRAKARFDIEQERMEARRLHDLDMMKIKFFTNLSHEFRTPLSLILTPLDKVVKTNDGISNNQLRMVHRNARRLLNLINQLLDFRKMELRELRLYPTEGNIIRFIKDITFSFSDLAEKNNIVFSFHSSGGSFYTRFDHDKIERILFNLLSNAFKFTPGNGNVSVEVNVQRGEGDPKLEIKVCDTGIGISSEKQQKIFERFFQSDVPGNMVNHGSGIGLAITSEFVKLHNGAITVESEVNHGSCFTVTLSLKELDGQWLEANPTLMEKAEGEEVVYSSETVALPLVDTAAAEPAPSPGRQTILLIEDNDDMRFYVKDNLQQYFNIVEAADGKTGWQKALSSHPGIIVSDIAMPGMTGIELCRKLKADKRTAAIPVILLTAVAGEEQQLIGLETGASDYITKPFNFEILLRKIRNLLAQQDNARRTYQKRLEASPGDITIDSEDEKFMHRAVELMEKNVSNPDFSVVDLSKGLYISRVALYKKLFELTGKTPVEFIRHFRLQRAAQLLEKSKLTIAEVAYEVGFNDSKYFSRLFKAEFNMLPSAYHAAKKAEVV